MQRRREINRSKKPLSWYITWVIIDLTILAVASGFVFSLPIWRIENVEVKGSNYLMKEKIAAVAKIPIGENIFLMDLDEISQRYKDIVQIKKVKIKRKLPRTLVIQIEERKPFAIVVVGSVPELIDDDGYVIAKKNLSASVYRADIGRFPVIRGFNKNSIDPTGRLSISERNFINEAIALLSKFLDLGAIQIELSDRSNIIIYIEDYLKVRLGDYSNIEKKTKVLNVLLRTLSGKLEKIKYIDVRVPDSPVVKYK